MTEAEKRRLQDAFRRLSASSGHVSRQVFIKEVVGDALPALLAEQIYRYPYYDNFTIFFLFLSPGIQIEIDFWRNMNSFEQEYDIQPNLVIKNFLVTLRLFLMPKVPYPYEVNGKLVTGNGSLIHTNLFIIKPFLIAKFDCAMVVTVRFNQKVLMLL